jgi:uncharacterized SAM-binding protein YcdF (DUF218 family)
VFVLSKIVGAFLQPMSLLLAILTLALLWHHRRPQRSRALLAIAVLTIAGFHLMPGAYWLVTPLEERFPQPTLPDHVDGIIVLGGAIEADASAAVHQIELNDSAERVFAGVALARRYPEARLLYSGGSGLVRDQDHREADTAQVLLLSLGMDPQRVIFERNSRNTRENAVDSMQLAQPKAGETWLLVTSAWHMPRSVGCFRRAGWQVTPYPVDYAGAEVHQWLGINGDVQLHIATEALKEWAGLVAYHLLGYTDAWFPSPSSSHIVSAQAATHS